MRSVVENRLWLRDVNVVHFRRRSRKSTGTLVPVLFISTRTYRCTGIILTGKNWFRRLAASTVSSDHPSIVTQIFP